MEVYIRQQSYSRLRKMIDLAVCAWRTEFPNVADGSEGEIYWSHEGEIITPAGLVLLTHLEWDKEHMEFLNTTRVVRLRKIPHRPGWWLASFVA
jgi:hypothetical protein